MITKTFKIQERVNNEWINQYSCNTRAQAMATLAKIFNDDENADPQNFKIEVSESVDEVGVLTSTANKIDEALSIFLKHFEIKNFVVDGGGFIEMRQPTKYPALNGIEINRLMKVIDDVNADLPEGYEVFFNINHECGIRLFLMTPKADS